MVCAWGRRGPVNSVHVRLPAQDLECLTSNHIAGWVSLLLAVALNVSYLYEEFIQFRLDRLGYFKDWSNVIDTSLITITFLFIPFFGLAIAEIAIFAALAQVDHPSYTCVACTYLAGTTSLTDIARRQIHRTYLPHQMSLTYPWTISPNTLAHI